MLVKHMILKISIFLMLCFSFVSFAQQNPPPHNPPYPNVWWAAVPEKDAASWEILPQRAKYGEVILSKRTELGILSNFAATPFTFRGKRYASVEGFWQATKYPEILKDSKGAQIEDKRVSSRVTWPHTRSEVEGMTAFEAKRAGDLASENMTKLGIDWVSFAGKKMTYKQTGESEFYLLIVEAMKAKLEQNPPVKKILEATGSLVLRPDHVPGPAELKAWQYHDIWMSLR
jgi:predicted NAD-dependent protein-ADP-ribosyltransferase YbiA (DUF1768 family)